MTDVTNASRTMLMDLETLDWDDELLSFFDIPRAMLPDIRPSGDSAGYGEIEQPHLLGGVRPTGALGDQHAAMAGQVCFAPGEAKNTYGTGNFLLLNTGRDLVRSKHGLLTTVCYQFDAESPAYALEGSIAVTGSAVQWLRDQLGIIAGAAESRNSPARSTTTAACTSCPRSPACSHRIGAAMPAAPSSDCPGSTPTRTWPGQRWKRSATRAGTSPRPWRKTRE